MNRVDEVSSRKRTSWWISYMPSLISVVLVICSAAYVTTLADTPRIQITANDDRPVVIQNTKVYEQAAQELLAKSVLNKSKLTINTNKVANDLQKQFPELGDVIVTVPLISRKLIIQASPAEPILVLNTSNGSYVIDATGTAVLTASQLVSSSRDVLPVITDNAGVEAEIGRQLLTTDLVSFVSQLAAQLAAKEQVVQSYSLPALANELHVRLEGKGYYIKFNTEIDPRLQVGTYLALDNKLMTDGILPAEYVDVRVEERAYYK